VRVSDDRVTLERLIAETQAEADRLERELFVTQRLIRVGIGALMVVVPFLILALVFGW
jgi:hypothetical protein